jgi:hypothetical protein
MRVFVGLIWLGAPLWAQPCTSIPNFSPCDFSYEMNDAEASANPNPYASVALHAEFRSPRQKTYLMPGFWAGGKKLVVRFAPGEPGQWTYRVTSSIKRFDGQTGTFLATESPAAGYVRPANLHHWATLNSENTNLIKPHLWMGDTCFTFATISREAFDQMVNARAEQKFNHIRGLVLGWEAEKAWPAPDRPNHLHFAELDERLLYMNSKGITADLVLAGGHDALKKVLPSWQDREKFIRYLVARYSSMNVTWQGIHEWETYTDGRDLMKEIGLLLKKIDPFDHPRSSDSAVTASPLGGNQWMHYMAYGSANVELGAIEHQTIGVPFVQLRPGYEDSGAGKYGPADVTTDAFRRSLWNTTMNGQYPTFGNTGTYGAPGAAFSPRYLESPGARQMTAWFDFFSDTRHWELEPYFDVDGGRAMALEGIEYVVYVEKPGPVEVRIEKHGYDVRWFNPSTGEYTALKKYKGAQFAGEPPDRNHDWVLHISREGKKEGMLNSYKFDSREYPLQLQVPEQTLAKVPFEIAAPAGDSIETGKPLPYSVKLKRETRATRSMMYLWTGEVLTDGQGARVLGTGKEGTLTVPPEIVRKRPNVLSLRVTGMNANGKIYIYDKALKLGDR